MGYSSNMSEIFGVDRSVITKHISNVYDSGELDPALTSAKTAQVRTEGNRSVSRDVTVYSLDVVISVGYRVNSVKATKFRQWATETLRQYMTQGYVINAGGQVPD